MLLGKSFEKVYLFDKIVNDNRQNLLFAKIFPIDLSKIRMANVDGLEI